MQFQINQNGGGERRDYHFIFVIVPRFNLMTLITMIETLRIANYLLPYPAFSWDILSFETQEVSSSNGMRISANIRLDGIEAADLIILLSSWGGEHYYNRDLISWLRKRYLHGNRICAVELGCYLLAKAGLLSKKRATTHWSWITGFQERFDDIEINEQLFTIQDRIMTCAGGLAGIDLMLKLIETSHGASLSGEIADQMLHHPIKQETDPQRRTMGQGIETVPKIVSSAITLIEKHIEEPMTIPEIAAKLKISQRQLERQFKKNVGCTVVQFGLILRLQRARVLLISTELSVRQIATASGFNTLSHFGYSFGKYFGRRPSEYREAWPKAQATPSWPGTLSDFLRSLEGQKLRKNINRSLPS